MHVSSTPSGAIPPKRSERVSFTGGQGFELAGILDQPHGEPKAFLLFTHCFTCNKDLKAIVRISRGLAARGFAVLRYDLTGLGGSQGDFSLTNFSTNGQDLLAAHNFLATNFEAPRFLIGHSFGGACSLSMAESLVSVLGVASLASPSDTAHLAKLLNKMDPEILVKGLGNVSIGGRDYAIRKQMLEDFEMHDLPAMLRQLTKPTLLFHSPEDETLGFEHVLRLFSFLTQRSGDDPEPSPASLICLPKADHLFTRNPADIELVVSVMTSWFERILSS